VQSDSIDRSTFVLKVEDVSKTYDSAAGKIVALSNINFTIKKNEFVSNVGPSGSGKSTLLNILGALDKPSSGMVMIDGVDFKYCSCCVACWVGRNRDHYVHLCYRKNQRDRNNESNWRTK
jgi:ABC-type oligopeptide transport system ATPase subunit